MLSRVKQLSLDVLVALAVAFTFLPAAFVDKFAGGVVLDTLSVAKTPHIVAVVRGFPIAPVFLPATAQDPADVLALELQLLVAVFPSLSMTNSVLKPADVEELSVVGVILLALTLSPSMGELSLVD